MKRNYLRKIDMARDLAKSKGIGEQDAKSRVSNEKLKPNKTVINLEHEYHDVEYFETPERWLDKSSRPSKD